VAAGFADALAGLGIGPAYPRPLPDVANGPRVPAVLSAAPGDGEAVLSWKSPPGATAEYVWVRDATTGEPWIKLPVPLGGNGWTAGELVNYDAYEFRLQAEKGSVAAEDLYSNVVTVTPARPAPGPVSGLAATPTDHGLAVTWAAGSGATGYRVTWWPDGEPRDAAEATTTDTSLSIEALQAGRSYDVAVVPVNDRTPGPQASTVGVPVGPVPAVPVGLRIRARGDRSVVLRWSPVAEATAYQVQRRREGGWRLATTTATTRFATAPVRAGGTVALRVRSVDQYVVSGLSDAVQIRLARP